MKPDHSELTIKVASEAWEFEEIHRLNYRTFVEEIPQHAPNPEGRLVDRFHDENTYVVVRQGRTLVGMVALRARRPFSLDGKLPDLDTHLPAGRKPVEVRLLSILPEFRKTSVFVSLLEAAVRRGLDDACDLAVISGTTRQLKLYHHLGFTPFGPRVGTPEAPYQPMYLTREAFDQTVRRSAAFRAAFGGETPAPRPLNLLPGPVLTSPAVDAAFRAPPYSHRSPAFIDQLNAVRGDLRALTGARDVQILPGSGSLGTSVVAAQLSRRAAPGVVVSNGEFGERLAAESRRAGLQFRWLRRDWGETIDLDEVRAAAAQVPPGGWLWSVHHETSTSVLNPLEELKRIAVDHGLRLCVDCISSLGAIPVDLRGVHLATGSSSKGLGAYPGLALVFHDYEPTPEPDRIPGYLDLGHWAAHASSPYTHSSNLVAALAAGVRQVVPERLRRIDENARWLRGALRDCGFALFAPESAACAAGITLCPRETANAAQLGEDLERRGFLLNFRSSHLQRRNLLQLSLLGDPPRDGLERFLHAIRAARGAL